MRHEISIEDNELLGLIALITHQLFPKLVLLYRGYPLFLVNLQCDMRFLLRKMGYVV